MIFRINCWPEAMALTKLPWNTGCVADETHAPVVPLGEVKAPKLASCSGRHRHRRVSVPLTSR